MNVFESVFEKRSAEFVIGALTPQGKVGHINWHTLPTPEEEAAVKQRIAAGKPDLERQALLLHVIAGEQKGDLTPEIRSPALLKAATEQWPTIQEANKQLGKFTSLEFLNVDQRGFDVYKATYENGLRIYRVGALTADHKLKGLLASGPVDLYPPAAPLTPLTPLKFP